MTAPLNPQSIIYIADELANEDEKEEKTTSTYNSLKRFLDLYWKAILTELVSTTSLLLFGCMTCVPPVGSTQQLPLYAPLGFGLVVLINVHIFGHISGAQMNPAVTLTAVFRGLTPVSLAIVYVIVQCIGAILGYGILYALAPDNLVSLGICATVPTAGQRVYQTIGIEIALTAVLCLVCCSAWDSVNKDNQDSMSLKFGFVVAGLSIAGGPLTGAGMNPARSLGPAIWTNVWTVHWAYWVGPILGSVLAAIIYWTISPKRETMKSD